jgi:phage major head subunit gpT-like protein
MAFSTALNPDVVKTALDSVFMQEFTWKEFPGHVGATSSLVFQQETTDKAAEIDETFKGVSLFEAFAEESDVPMDQPRIANQKTFSVLTYGKSIDIPKNFFDDNNHGSYEKMVKDFAMKARISMDDNAMNLYRQAFVTTSFTTPDGASIVSDTHTNINGDTIDNRITAALSETSLNTAITMLYEMKDEAGVIVGGTPQTLFVPPALFKTACEIVDSELRSGTADNDMNVYSSKFGINVCTSNRIGTAAGGSDTAWFLLGRNHSMTRWVRQGIQTELVDYKFQRNNNYIYKANFREMVGCRNYLGIVGSLGTT